MVIAEEAGGGEVERQLGGGEESNDSEPAGERASGCRPAYDGIRDLDDRPRFWINASAAGAGFRINPQRILEIGAFAGAALPLLYPLPRR